MRKTPRTPAEREQQLQYYRDYHHAHRLAMYAQGYTILQRWVRLSDKDALSQIIELWATLSDTERSALYDSIAAAAARIIQQAPAPESEAPEAAHNILNMV